MDLDDAIRSIDRIKTDESFARRVYGSITNTKWSHPEYGDDFGYTFRGAGALIAEMRGNTDTYGYMEFYCSSPEGVIDPEFAEIMRAHGWEGRQYD